jgi:predicted small integral membrane protein
VVLVLAAALHWSIVVFNNLVDHPTNLMFVQHVLSMDAVVEANRESWRAIHDPNLQHAVYWLIILTEAAACAWLWAGGASLLKSLRADEGAFVAAKQRAVQGLTLVLLLLFCGFTSIGGEWFMMWQAGRWDATQAAGRLFAMHGLILLWLSQPEPG